MPLGGAATGSYSAASTISPVGTPNNSLDVFVPKYIFSCHEFTCNSRSITSVRQFATGPISDELWDDPSQMGFSRF